MTDLVLPPDTVHFAIDMQRVFAEKTDWHLPGFDLIVPKIAALSDALPDRTSFTRFMVPHTAEQARGHWQVYYRRWHGFTGAVMDPGLVDLVDSLARYAMPDLLIDKLTYSVFESPRCEEILSGLQASTIIFSGVETDVCVLASLMSAIDRGYRVIAAADALASSSTDGHKATLKHILTRMPDQVEIASTAEILRALDRR